MADSGFNVIRLPFAGSCVQDGVIPLATGISFVANPDLKDLSTIEVMRKVIFQAGNEGLRVILDFHRLDRSPANGAPEEGLWYNATLPVSYWLETWRIVATAFKDEPAVVGVDLWNEPHQGNHLGPFWNDNATDPNNFLAAAKKAADIIQSVQPDWLIFVQGMWQDTWWAGNLKEVRNYPLNLTVSNKLVYSIHDYGPAIFDQVWFQAPDFPSNLASYWDQTWGFVHNEGIAPIWVGEFGSIHNFTNLVGVTLKESQWLTSIVQYIGNKSLSWTWFTWGPNSGDTGGILQDDWNTVNADKLLSIDSILYPSYALKTASPSKANSLSGSTTGISFWLMSLCTAVLITYCLE